MEVAPRKRVRQSRAKDPSERKRPIYVQLACHSCKQRKIRCDGCSPCASCEKHSEECFYEAGSEHAQRHRHPKMRKTQVEPEMPNEAPGLDFEPVSPATALRRSLALCNSGFEALGDTFASLDKRLSALEKRRSDTSLDNCSPFRKPTPYSAVTVTNDNVLSAVGDRRRGSVFAGPTSANFSFQIADLMSRSKSGHSSENKRGDDSADIATEDEIEVCVSPEDDASHEDRLIEGEITLAEAVRLLRVYNDVMNSLHPILDVDALVCQAEGLFAAGRTITKPTADDTCLLRLVIAVALLAEKGGFCPTALALYQSIKPLVAEIALDQIFTLDGQTLLVVTAFFHMFHDDLRSATRVVAAASRIAIEAGLHRKQVVLQRFPEANERKKVMVLTYTLTIVDRQLNFNSGLPFTMRDIEIDVSESDDIPPYVRAMASYVDFGAQAWAGLLDSRGRLKGQFEENNYQYLSYQVKRWQESLPEDLQPQRHFTQNPQSGSPPTSEPDNATSSVRCMLYLRANQIKILILRPLLFSARSARAKPDRVCEVSQIAKDTIDRIVEMNQATDLCSKQWPILSQFLSSALSTLLLLHVQLLHGLQLKPISNSQLDGMTIQKGIKDGIHLIRTAKSRSCRRLWDRLNRPSGLLRRLGFESELKSLRPGSEPVNVSPTHACAEMVSANRPHFQFELVHGETFPHPSCNNTLSNQSLNPPPQSSCDLMELDPDLVDCFPFATWNDFDPLVTDGLYAPPMPDQFDTFL